MRIPRITKAQLREFFFIIHRERMLVNTIEKPYRIKTKPIYKLWHFLI